MTNWTDAPLVAVDLEGSGAQDRDREAILEIALIPIIRGHPSLPNNYTTLINPGRPIRPAPWISPGLTGQALASAPALADVAPELTARLDDKILVGHNVGVDERLLRRHIPNLRIAGRIDTLRLARHLAPDERGNGLGDLLERHELTSTVDRLAPGSQPHRALWDTIGAAVLLGALIRTMPDGEPLSFTALSRIADPEHRQGVSGQLPGQISLLDI